MLKEYKILDYKDVKTEEWDRYVYNHQDGNIFQTLTYLQIHTKSNNSIPFGFALYQNNHIIGVISGVIYQNYFFPVNILTRRAVIMGGPLVDHDNEVLTKKLLIKTNEYLEKKVVYIQIRNIRNVNHYKDLFLKSGYRYEEHLDIIHNLEADTETIKKGISKNKRNNVVKAQNRGASFNEITDIEEYCEGIKLILETYKRVGLPCPTADYFINAFHSLSGVMKSFAVKYETKIVGFRLELCYKDMVYDWYAGSDDQFKNCYPNDVLPYNILFWAKEHGFSKFDFGGAGKPNVPYGVREHKLKFGGELVNYGRFELVNNKLIMSFSGWAFKLFKKIKTKM